MVVSDQVCSAEEKTLQELTESFLKKIRAIKNPQTLNNKELLANASSDLFLLQNQLEQFRQSQLANTGLVSKIDNLISRIDYHTTLVRFRQSAVSAKEKLQEAHHVLSVFGRQQVDNTVKIPAEKHVRRLSF